MRDRRFRCNAAAGDGDDPVSATAVAFIPLRVVTPGLPLGLAPSGRVACQLPLVFPNKFVAENLDYTVDFSFAAGAAAVPGAALGGFSVTAVPLGRRRW